MRTERRPGPDANEGCANGHAYTRGNAVPVNERDDIAKLPIPKIAKAYARRTGLKSMMRQPKDFAAVNAKLMNPTWKRNKFKLHSVGQTLGNPRGGMKEAARRVIATLLQETDADVSREEAEPMLNDFKAEYGDSPRFLKLFINDMGVAFGERDFSGGAAEAFYEILPNIAAAYEAPPPPPPRPRRGNSPSPFDDPDDPLDGRP